MSNKGNKSWVEAYWQQGFVRIPGLFSQAEIAELKQAFDDMLKTVPKQAKFTNYHYTDVDGEQRLFFVKWPSEVNKTLDRFRLHPKVLALVTEILGGDLNQNINQMHYKQPGDGIYFPYHQDSHFRRPEESYRNLYQNFLQTGIAVDEATRENGCVEFFPGTHLEKRGLLQYEGDPKDYDSLNQETIAGFGDAAYCTLDPGDVVIWNGYTVHGSAPNKTNIPRRFYINGFVRSDSTDRGLQVVKNGDALPLDLNANPKWDEVESYEKIK